MSGSSETELKHLISSLHIPNIGFLGTFDCRFPGFIDKNKKQSAIVNTGPRESGGMHWIAFAWDPASYKMFMFDPLGWTARDLTKYYGFSYQNLLRRSAMSTHDRCVILEKNTQAVQCTCAGSCGLFCVFFLYNFHLCPSSPFSTSIMQNMQGTVPTIKPLYPYLLHENQNKLYSFLYNKSSYFRKNAQTIIDSTKTGLIKTH